MKNSTLLKAASKIIENTSPAQFIITAKFISSAEGSTFSFYPFKIEKMTINQDFIDNFADEIFLSMIVSPKDYALMQDQGQNLLCILTITYINRYGKIVYTPPPIQKQYNVLISDPRDIRKAIPDVQFYTDPTTPMTVQLVELVIYKLRHRKLNTIYQNVTATQAIYALTQAFDITKIQLVPLDNTHQYDHIDVASHQGVGSVYRDLQTKYGLYAKGANSYITNSVLYVYPPFETTPIYDKTVIFYQVETGHFSGSHIFHQVENNSVSIVVNTQPESYDLSIAGAENVGTGFIFTRASRMADGFTTIDDKEGAKFTDLPALAVSLVDNGRTVVDKSSNIFRIKATDNPYPAMSEIASHQASLMEVIWKNADPFQLDPGHAVTYYYDRNEVMVKKTGILEKARYDLMNAGKMNTKDKFEANGTLTLRLSTNTTMSL